MTKNTGLASFSRKQTTEGDPHADPQATTLPRKKAAGKLVSLTVRLTRPQWERLHQLAVSEGVSLQQLAVLGLSNIFEAKGLKGL